MNLAQLLVFRLRLEHGAHFRFFHNPTVYAYLMDRLREMVRFAAGLDARRRLSAEAQDRALACLARFGQRLSTILLRPRAHTLATLYVLKTV